MSPLEDFVLENTVGAALLARAKKTPERTAFRIWKSTLNRFETLTFAQLHFESHYLSIGLSELGVKAGDRIAIQSSVRAEWLIADLAIMGTQALSVPISPSASREELLYFLRHSQAIAVFVEDERLLKALLEVRSAEAETLRSLKAIILIDAPLNRPADQSGDFAVATLPALREFGLERESMSSDQFEKSLRALKPDDALAIAYTAGTTGNPKGVVLSHRNLCSVINDSARVLGRFLNSETDGVFSLLDSSSILSRVELYAALVFGWTRLFADQNAQPEIALPRLQPNVLFSTTGYFEEVYREAALKLAEPSEGHFATLMKRLRENPVTDWVLSNPIRVRVGDHLRIVICAGTSLPDRVIDFFASAGVTLLTGYGSTETCGTIALNTPDEFRVGSAGRPLPDVSIRISEEGEILVRSDKVFSGYYREPEESRSVLKEGWFHTGDAGSLDSDGFLHVTDRKRDLLILKSGARASPLRFERLAKLNPYFRDLFVFGEAREYLTALVTLDRGKILDFAEKNGILFTHYEDLLRSPNIRYLVQKGIEEINAQAQTPERLRKFIILPQPFGEETGEITRSRRLRRARIEEKFKTELESLYLDSPELIR